MYINLATPYVEGDATILQHRLDALEFKLKLKDTDIKNFTDKYKVVEEQNKALRLVILWNIILVSRFMKTKNGFILFVD